MSETWTTVLTYLGVSILTLGSTMTLIAAIGVVKLPTLLQRQHAATKPQLTGFILTCLGLVAIRQTWSWLTVVMLAIVLQTITAPIGAHLIGRTAKQRGEIKDAGETIYRHLHLPVPGKDPSKSEEQPSRC
ncbi:monovalent cation/H(+) antiporter subunit G [Varibaculum vaginae]|uniref:monovalent cation/H(+) antiporter subunit G n=1 Tax=Varibaculum vaginae TaxID=2364797 RepID=UPI000F098423|nr:monovalent cation/H(+) antiporter subunit G [Varibaculum vaginae]